MSMNDEQRGFVERTLGWSVIVLGFWTAGVAWTTAQDFARDYGLFQVEVERRDARNSELSASEQRDRDLLESPIELEKLLDPNTGLFERGHAILRDWERVEGPTPEVSADRDRRIRSELIGVAAERFLWFAGPAVLLALPLWWARRYLVLRRR
jgi:hypothetical protein